ncbi:hypothetical protein JYU34_001460 [Plutella xylostella]|uniref:Uncharacterized protein n=1 Tax=Plutella xylostella TaxID=51655 RepID=A0ABQ7R3Z1_PLUXY|nr:hypothetical protein JYU34_001460 [Plutella xylostella]
MERERLPTSVLESQRALPEPPRSERDDAHWEAEGADRWSPTVGRWGAEWPS